MAVARDNEVTHDLSALAWVHDELRRTLEAAHKSLRRYLKEADALGGSDVDTVDPAILRHARAQMHQGAGALELVGMPTAALMLRAAESAVSKLAAKSRGITSAHVDVIERGSFALLDYLARLLAGKLISPAAMFPQYKALQELAGAGRVHPADLWNRDWQWRTIKAPDAPSPRRPDADTQAELENETLAMMRGRDAGAAHRMSDLLAGLAAGSKDRLATLWQLASAVYEAQAGGLLKVDVYGKRLASRLLAQLRAGESADASDRLAQDLLFFCAQAVPSEGRPAGPRLAAARKAFDLKNPNAVDYESARLGRFDPAMLAQARKRVAAAKDVWSAVAGGDLQRLPGLAEQFALVGESLQKLYPEGETLAKSLLQSAAHTVHNGGSVTPEHAMEVATSLLYVDASLEDQDLDHPELSGRVQRLAQRIDGVRQGHSPGALEVWMEDLYRRVSDRQTMGSVVQELRASLSEIEKHIDQFFRNTAQREVLIPVPAQLSSMRGVLSVLGQDHASHAVVRMRDDVDSLITADANMTPQGGAFDRLADNLGALSFLIDMLSVQPQMAKSLFRFDAASGQLESVMDRAHRPSVFGALDGVPAFERELVEKAGEIAKSASASEADASDVARDLEKLARQAEAADQRSIATAADKAQRALKGAESGDERKEALAQAAKVMTELVKPHVDAQASKPAPLKPLPPPVVAAPPVPPGQTGLEDDTEMRDIFLEEAREVMQTARAALAELAKAPNDLNEMTSVRRAFHTLKGSSRMVGLKDFGEAAWGCEQLYNARLADGGGADGDLLQFSGEALDYLGRWIEGVAANETEGFNHRVVGRAADAMRNERRRISLTDEAVSALGNLNAAPVTATLPVAAPVQVAPSTPPVPALSSQPAAEPVQAVAVPDMTIDLDFGADAPAIEVPSISDAPTETLALSDLPTQTFMSPVQGNSPTNEPIDLIELELPEVDAEPLMPRDVLGAPETRPDALQTMPAALGPFIDSETGRLEEPREAQAAAETLDLGDADGGVPVRVTSGADADQVKVIGPLRIPIPLFNIFLNEADEHSRRLATEIAEWSHELHRRVGESTVAHAHSLAGNCATVGYTDLSNLARALEHALARADARGHGVAEEAQLFAAAAEEIRRLLHQFAAGFLKSPDPDLLRFLIEHEHLAVPAPAAAVESPVQHTKPASDFAPIQPLAAKPAFTEFGHTELRTLGELGEAAARSAAHVQPSARADALDDADDIDAVDAVDAELFPIFEEEGQELIPELQSRMREWMRRPTEAAAASACMRTLHTLKGGARLAGAMRLGEMAHRLETAIEHLVGRGHASADDVERLVARVDAIETRFEMLRRGEADHSQPMALEPHAPLAEAPAIQATVEPLAPFVPVPVVSHVEPAIEASPIEQAAETAAPVAEPQPVAASAAPAQQIDWSRFSAGGDTAVVSTDPIAPSGGSQSAVRVRSQLLDRLVSHAGEVSITRSRIEADVAQLKTSLGDLTENLERLRRQLRDIELQAETQITSRMEAAKASLQAFDPLEMDRFTRFQELTRMMAESVNDVATVQRALQRTLQSTEDELAAQARLTRDLQDDLLRTRMVEFEGMSERLYRLVRQAAKETGKQVRLDIVGGAIEVDRGVLDRMTGAFEHLLRNSVTHGIESPAARAAASKDPTGSIVVTVTQEGNEVSVEFRDDGAGLNLPRIREKGRAMGLIAADSNPSDGELANLIFTPGFSTAESVTGLAGRGVGMDVVRADVNAMGGRIETATAAGRGTSFRLVLPLTTAVTQVVMLRCGELRVAVPSTLVEIVKRSPQAELETAYATSAFRVDDRSLPFFWLGALLQASARGMPATRAQPVVIIRSAAQRIALHVDEVLGNQEVVVKNLGPQLARLPGLAGMTLLPSGEPALIYNPVALATLYGESAWAMTRAAMVAPDAPVIERTAEPAEALPPLVLVVDDSLTVRRVTQRLLQREGYRVTLAKDGLEGLEKLGEERPAVLLSDIEMPRMDGFDLVRNLRADPKLADLPVIMITSRIAQKHRDYAAELGVDHYLGKPYAEEDLLSLVARYAKAAALNA